VVVSTHDVEFAAIAADRVVVMATGDIVADGPTADVVGRSPSIAPQVAKILAPLEYLTIDQVARSLGAAFLDPSETGLPDPPRDAPRDASREAPSGSAGPAAP
jgi:energy-coupling factor transporter ATP-binding protein EcfA2